MRVVLQRVSSASVIVGDRVSGRIGRGLLVFVGIEPADTEADGRWLADKIVKLRIFADESAAGPGSGRVAQMSRSVTDVGGDILLVSQFTLHASTARGTRPSFSAAAPPALARPLYERFIAQLAAALGRPPATGEFGASMQVHSVNDGPVTLVVDSKARA